MAVADALVSVQFLDATGEISSCDVPIQYTVGTTTLPNLVSWVQGLGASIDTVTEGQITKLRISLLIPLPGGLKSAPVANSDAEETGLITFSATGTPNAYGLDVPAWLQSLFTGNQIDQTNILVTGFLTYLTTPTTGIVATDRYGNALATVRRAVKTFRKHRRALRRS